MVLAYCFNLTSRARWPPRILVTTVGSGMIRIRLSLQIWLKVLSSPERIKCHSDLLVQSSMDTNHMNIASLMRPLMKAIRKGLIGINRLMPFSTR